MRRTTCDCTASAASSALAPLGGGVVHACQPATSSERSLAGERPFTHARTVSTAAEPFASGARTVSQPAQALAFAASVPSELWKPGTASVVGPPVPGSSIRFEPASRSPNGLFGVQPWCVDGTRLAYAIATPAGPVS